MFDLGKIDKGLLRKRSVDADSEDLGVFGGELGIVLVRTGRLKMLDSTGIEVELIKIDQDSFALQGA